MSFFPLDPILNALDLDPLRLDWLDLEFTPPPNIDSPTISTPQNADNNITLSLLPPLPPLPGLTLPAAISNPPPDQNRTSQLAFEEGLSITKRKAEIPPEQSKRRKIQIPGPSAEDIPRNKSAFKAPVKPYTSFEEIESPPQATSRQDSQSYYSYSGTVRPQIFYQSEFELNNMAMQRAYLTNNLWHLYVTNHINSCLLTLSLNCQKHQSILHEIVNCYFCLGDKKYSHDKSAITQKILSLISDYEMCSLFSYQTLSNIQKLLPPSTMSSQAFTPDYREKYNMIYGQYLYYTTQVKQPLDKIKSIIYAKKQGSLVFLQSAILALYDNNPYSLPPIDKTKLRQVYIALAPETPAVTYRQSRQRVPHEV